MNHQRILSWADHHLDGLEAAFRAYWESQPNPLVTEYDAVTGEQVVSYVPRLVNVDEEWVFRIGDAVHNQRIALDYLAFQIVGKLPTPPKTTKIGFPICQDPSKWAEMRGRRLGKNLPTNIQDAFEKLQPYHRGITTHFHPLALLDTLENIHKHRRLLSAKPAVTAVMQQGSSTRIAIRDFFNPNGLALDQRTVLYRYRVLDEAHAETDVQFVVREFVTFREPELGPGTEGTVVLKVLRRVAEYLREDVFPALEPFVS